MSVVATLPPSTQTLTAPGHYDDYVPTQVSRYDTRSTDDETVNRALEAGRSLLEASSDPTSEFSDLTSNMAKDILGETFDGVGQGYDKGRLAAMSVVDNDGFIKAGTAYNNLKAMRAELQDLDRRTEGALSEAMSQELGNFSQKSSKNNALVQRSIADSALQLYHPQPINQVEPSAINSLVPANVQSQALASIQPSWMSSDDSEPLTPTQMIVAPQTGMEDQHPDLSHLTFDQLRDYFLTRVNRQQGRRVLNTPSLQQTGAQPSALEEGRRPLLSQHASNAFYGFRDTLGTSQSVESVCETMRNGGGDGAQWKQDSPDGVQRAGGHASGITADGFFVSVSYSSTSFGPSAAGRSGATRVTVDDGESPYSLMPARYGAMSSIGGP